MKFLKPLLKKITSKPSSFGQNRVTHMENSLSKAKQERKMLVKKEYLSPDPLKTAYRNKGYRLDVQIRKMQDEK